jgi:3',5'-nucleoside bisphosphate phosphatase
MRRIDLHAHTSHSDGTFGPEAVVRLAAEAGLAAIAITDHDVTSALAAAEAEGRAAGVEVIAGCEISATLPSGIVHVLAWGFDPADAALQELLAEVRGGRVRRNERMLERLDELGVPVTAAEVAAHAEGDIVARPHFALAMVERGHVPDLRAAFDRYLADDGPAFVAAELPHPREAIGRVVAAGGVTAVAHPRQIGLQGRPAWRALFAELAASGLAGIEVDHPSHKAHHRRFFARLAEELGLVATGGSDFHGTNKPYLRLGEGDGTIAVPYETWERLQERRR